MSNELKDDNYRLLYYCYVGEISSFSRARISGSGEPTSFSAVYLDPNRSPAAPSVLTSSLAKRSHHFFVIWIRSVYCPVTIVRTSDLGFAVPSLLQS